jgi:hypothetical protein
MEKKRSTIFYLNVLFFGLCIVFIMLAGCTSILHSVEKLNEAVTVTTAPVETIDPAILKIIDKNNPTPTPTNGVSSLEVTTLDLYKYCSDTYPGTSYNPSTNKCEHYYTTVGLSTPQPTVAVPTSTIVSLLHAQTPTPAITLSSIYPITIVNNLVNIPYNTNWAYSFKGNSGNVYHVSVGASSLIDILVMDQSDYNIYQNAFKSGSAVTFTSVSYKSVSSKDFDYILPSSGTYYVVIDNWLCRNPMLSDVKA